MRLSIAVDAAAAAAVAATRLEQVCLAAQELRGRAVIAVSGGNTPWLMLQLFTRARLPWPSIHVTQVDERCVPRDDPRRNLLQLERVLVREGPLPADNLLPLPVDAADTAGAIADHVARLTWLTDANLTLDLVQLGLGADGHTASLVPADPVLEERYAPVALTAGPYEGTRRMTLTYAVLDAARERLWVVTGPTKSPALAALAAGTGDAPAVRVSREASMVVADRDAAGNLRS